jgi:hypothetical protein
MLGPCGSILTVNARGFGGGGSAALNACNPLSTRMFPQTFSQMMPYASIPDGTPSGWALAMKPGAIKLVMTGSADVLVNAVANGYMAAAMSGSATVDINGNMLASIYAAFSGVGDLDVEIGGEGFMQVAMKVAELSQGDVAGAVLDTPIEGPYTLRQLMRICSAVLAGKVSGGPGSPVYRDVTDSADRVAGTVDGNGNRSSTTITP